MRYAALLLLACLAPAPAAAEETDFTFRRVSVPATGVERRITVQIALLPVVSLPAPPVEEEPPAGPPVTAEADHLRALALRWGRDIVAATAGTSVSPALVLAVMSVESAGRPDALSPAGAQGLMQLMPATAARFGVRDPFRPAESIRGGVAYLHWLTEFFGGDARKVLAGYNAGEGAVLRHGGVPPYAETQDYVPKVMAAYNLARSLCAEPSAPAAGGCDFATR